MDIEVESWGKVCVLLVFFSHIKKCMRVCQPLVTLYGLIWFKTFLFKAVLWCTQAQL